MLGIFSILSVVLPIAAPPQAKLVDKIVDEAMRNWDVPGVALVVVTPNWVFHLKGYGTREVDGKAVTADTVFPLASCSKAFTTTLIAARYRRRKTELGRSSSQTPSRFPLVRSGRGFDGRFRDLAAHRTVSTDTICSGSIISDAGRTDSPRR